MILGFQTKHFKGLYFDPLSPYKFTLAVLPQVLFAYIVLLVFLLKVICGQQLYRFLFMISHLTLFLTFLTEFGANKIKAYTIF